MDVFKPKQMTHSRLLRTWNNLINRYAERIYKKYGPAKLRNQMALSVALLILSPTLVYFGGLALSHEINVAFHGGDVSRFVVTLATSVMLGAAAISLAFSRVAAVAAAMDHSKNSGRVVKVS